MSNCLIKGGDTVANALRRLWRETRYRSTIVANGLISRLAELAEEGNAHLARRCPIITTKRPLPTETPMKGVDRRAYEAGHHRLTGISGEQDKVRAGGPQSRHIRIQRSSDRKSGQRLISEVRNQVTGCCPINFINQAASSDKNLANSFFAAICRVISIKSITVFDFSSACQATSSSTSAGISLRRR